MDISKMSTVLEQKEEGIWVSQNQSSISYHTDGNIQCFQLEDASFWFNHRNNVISEVLRRFSPKNEKLTFLDIGGGNGYVSSRLVKDSHNVVLLEPGWNGALNAKTIRGIPNVICSTLYDAQFCENCFDSAGAFDVIEHIEDDSSFLKQIASILKPGGLFVMTVPAHRWLWSNEDVISGHYRRYTTKDIQKLVSPYFKTLFLSYFFTPLVLPVLFFRTIPSAVGLKKSRGKSQSSEHGVRNSLPTRFMRKLLIWELQKIVSEQKVRIGTSILFVGSLKHSHSIEQL